MMICPNCGQYKPDYHFFKHRNKYDKTFFAAGIPQTDICWACGGEYKCLGCGEVKPHTEFRVGGRFCHACKSVGISKIVGLKQGVVAPSLTDMPETAENAVYDVLAEEQE